MAAKGGGAWKVAYADFVTAMMAFFLVMWICNQDQKIRKAVADYFGHPLAMNNGTTSAMRSRSSCVTPGRIHLEASPRNDASSTISVRPVMPSQSASALSRPGLADGASAASDVACASRVNRPAALS